MGGGDLNMKKSWHPVLLVNQERVWKAEKEANEERKQLAQLRKEREEERQIAELKRMQEVATGKKAVEKLDWMYASSGNEGGALGGARISETMMEDYLLGKRRVDEVLAQSDKNVGNTHKDFIAVQNANTARDTAAKIREDPLLAIKKQEEAQLRAMANRPDIRRQLKAMKNGGMESKEERKSRKRAEKEERRKERHERREKRRERDDSPRSDYSDDRDRRRSYGRDRDEYGRDEKKSFRSRSRSSSPYSRRRDDSPRRRDRDDRDDYRRRDDSPKRVKRERDDDRDYRRSRDQDEDRVPPPRHYSNGHDHHANGRNGHSNGHSHGYANGHDSHSRSQTSRPSAMDMSDRPTSRPPPPSSAPNPNGKSLEEQRAARLAAMSQNAHSMQDQRTQSLAARAEQDRREAEKDARDRQRLGKEAANAGFFNQQRELGLSEALSRRGGQGLLRDI